MLKARHLDGDLANAVLSTAAAADATAATTTTTSAAV